MAKKTTGRKIADDSQQIIDLIYKIVDDFCRDHLNDEYAILCRKLTEKLARKRPSPLIGGKPNTWASGIIRTIGWVNFLDDSSKQPHMKLTAIDKILGVAESTGQGKSKLIRTMLKIRQFDRLWTLPNQMDSIPAIWWLDINGLIQDVRHFPREVQEVAFLKGLIPYIPADRPANNEEK
jgi:hypothetical protein